MSGSDENKFLWEVVDNHVDDDGKEHDEIGLRGFNFNFFHEDDEGVVGEGFIEYPYLLMLMKIWPGHWKNQLERMHIKVDEENGKSMAMANGWARKVWRF